MKRIVMGLGFLLCVAACSSSSSSGTGAQTVADAGNTVDAGKSGNANLGEACPNGDGDCLSGLLCDGADPGGGQCYKECAPSKDGDCGAGFVCDFEGHCYKECTQTSDCPRASQGYVCKDDSPARGVKFCDAAD
jgi:hypothetical protein